MKCYHSITLQTGRDVPCGRCVNCRTNRLLAMSFRLQVQERHSIASSFITLTYDTPSLLPLCTSDGYSLCKRDLQLFFKRLRKRCESKGVFIKYIACGEYGDCYKRPHYHILLFNVSELDFVVQSWPHGQCYFGDVSPASIGYCFKYMVKDLRLYKQDLREQPFRLFSKGLGIQYITPERQAYVLADLHNRKRVWNNGAYLNMPRYYVEKLYDGYQRDLLAMSGSLMRQHSDYIDILTGSGLSWQELRERQSFSTRSFEHKLLLSQSKF